MTMLELLHSNDVPGGTGKLTDQDLAILAAWGHQGTIDNKKGHFGVKRGYSLIREGADLLLRERVMAQANCPCCTHTSTQDTRESIESIHAALADARPKDGVPLKIEELFKKYTNS